MPLPESYDAIKDGQWMTLEDQISELRVHVPEWNGTLGGLAVMCYQREWEMVLCFDGFTGLGARCDIYDYSFEGYQENPDAEFPPLLGTGKWSLDNGDGLLYAAIRAFRKAARIPEYPQKMEDLARLMPAVYGMQSLKEARKEMFKPEEGYDIELA